LRQTPLELIYFLEAMKILQTDAGFLTHYEVLSTVVGQLDKYSNGGYTKDRGDTSPAPFLQKVRFLFIFSPFRFLSQLAHRIWFC
jgi:hypothetical protein